MKKLIDLSDTPKIKRNIFLAIFLSLIIIINMGTACIFLLNIFGIADRSAYLPLWMVIFNTLICLGNTICAMATWYWRKWGVIGYGILTLAAYIVTSVYTHDFKNYLGLTGSALLVIMVIPYWKSMKGFLWNKTPIMNHNKVVDL